MRMGQRDEPRDTRFRAADEPASPARRSFLFTGVAAVSAGLFLAGCGPSELSRSPAPPHFFKRRERDFVRAAIDRLIPADALGPGAVEAGVDTFIDAQLAGPFGQAMGIYMRGPFRLGTSEQGYQLPFTPAQVYQIGIHGVDGHCRKKLGGTFASLKSEQQDDVLHQLQDGKLDLGEVPSDSFFDLLWQNTKEGFLADPIYGGNRNFAGWKLIGYRGPRYNYVEEIEKFGKPYDAPYVSLGGRDPVTCRLSDSPTGRFQGPGCELARMPAKTHYAALTSKDGSKTWPAGSL
jgi:gluconate 2-dehydrogenase gamma chain